MPHGMGVFTQRNQTANTHIYGGLIDPRRPKTAVSGAPVRIIRPPNAPHRPVWRSDPGGLIFWPRSAGLRPAAQPVGWATSAWPTPLAASRNQSRFSRQSLPSTGSGDAKSAKLRRTEDARRPIEPASPKETTEGCRTAALACRSNWQRRTDNRELRTCRLPPTAYALRATRAGRRLPAPRTPSPRPEGPTPDPTPPAVPQSASHRLSTRLRPWGPPWGNKPPGISSDVPRNSLCPRNSHDALGS